MKFGKNNIVIDWRNASFWIAIVFFVLLSSVLAGFEGFLISILLSCIPVVIYLIVPVLGQYMGAMGSSASRPNYPTPSWLVRFFAWLVLVFFIIIMTIEFIVNPSL